MTEEKSWLRAYVEHNRKAILRDMSVALLWTGAIAFMVDQLAWPLWTFFTIFFGVWYMYMKAVPSWENPPRAVPDNE